MKGPFQEYHTLFKAYFFIYLDYITRRIFTFDVPKKKKKKKKKTPTRVATKLSIILYH